MAHGAEPSTPQLYLISPEVTEVEAFLPQLEEALSVGPVGAFQLRLKHASDADILRIAAPLMAMCHRYNTMFILNDRPDLAAQLGADGVHLGEEAERYEEARRLLGEAAVIGISCYGSLDRAVEFAEKGASYVAFGAFYPTTTKEPKARPEPEILSWWVRNSVIPCVAIGGIDANNCTPLLQAGADFIAVVRSAWQGTGTVSENIRSLLKSIEAAKELP